MAISSSAPVARNGNPGIVPAYLANPGSAAPRPAAPIAAKERAAEAAPASGFVPLSREQVEANLRRVDLNVPRGLQPLTDAGDAARGVRRGQTGTASSHWQQVPWSYEEMSSSVAKAQPTVSQEEKDGAIQALKGVRSYLSSLGIGPDEGNGGRLPVLFEPRMPNAAYAQTRDGREALIIGNDPDTGRSYARAKDVLAHEYTHRVVNNLVGLRSSGESGAVNESLADTIAAAIDPDDWTLGEDVRPGGLRSMDNPGRPQDALRDQYGRAVEMPDHMREYVRTPDDDGGVHINLGIPNKAASEIGKQLGRDTMAQIYVDAMRNYLSPRSGIADTARATIAASMDRFGRSSAETQAVVDAWSQVGLVARTR